MEILKSNKGFILPKSPNNNKYTEIEIEELTRETTKGLYQIKSGNFKGIINQKQLEELRKQAVLDKKEDELQKQSDELLEKKRRELQEKADKRRKELEGMDDDDVKMILEEMEVRYFDDAKKPELIELIIKNELKNEQNQQNI